MGLGGLNLHAHWFHSLLMLLRSHGLESEGATCSVTFCGVCRSLMSNEIKASALLEDVKTHHQTFRKEPSRATM